MADKIKHSRYKTSVIAMLHHPKNGQLLHSSTS